MTIPWAAKKIWIITRWVQRMRVSLHCYLAGFRTPDMVAPRKTSHGDVIKTDESLGISCEAKVTFVSIFAQLHCDVLHASI